MRQLLCLLLLCCWAVSLPAFVSANQITHAEAYIDIDPGEGAGQSLFIVPGELPSRIIAEASSAIDVSSLDPGYHTLYVRFLDSAGQWSDDLAMHFLRPEVFTTSGANLITAAEAYFDTDPGAGLATQLSFESGDTQQQILERAQDTLDVTTLAPGYHTIHVRFLDSKEQWSDTLQQPFLRPEIFTTDGGNVMVQAEAFIDTDPGVAGRIQLALDSGGGPAQILAQALDQIDLAAQNPAIEPGNHVLYLRMKDSRDAWGDLLHLPFFNPYPQTGASSTNTLTGAAYSIDYSPWVSIPAPVDGQFGGITETVARDVAVPIGYHTSKVVFYDSAGNAPENTPLPAALAYDTDGDGLADSWELEHFGNLDYNGLDDPDGDGLNNFAELFGGTDPGSGTPAELATISGKVELRQEDGSLIGLEGIPVCIVGQGMYNCETESAADGSFTLYNSVTPNLIRPLPDGEWRVFPMVVGDYLNLQFTPDTRTASTAGVPVTGVDFIAEVGVAAEPPPYIAGHLLGDPSRNGVATPAAGFGVNTVNGNFFHAELDASLPGKGIPFAFARYFNSQQTGYDSFGYEISSSLGAGWSHSYNIQLHFNLMQSSAEIVWGDGRRDGFAYDGTEWQAVTPGNFAILEPVSTNWEVQTQDHLRFIFDSSGRLTAIKRDYETGSGEHTMAFAYDVNGDLATITDTAGREVALIYDENHRLTQMDMPGAATNDCRGTGVRSVSYIYAGDGRLRSATDMNCNERMYIYGPSVMEFLWANTNPDSAYTAKLKVGFDDDNRVEKQETGLNLATGYGEYLFTWSDSGLVYQTPTGVGNTTFAVDAYNRVTATTLSGKTLTFSYVSDFGPEAILPSNLNDFEGHNYAATFTNTDLTAMTLPDNRVRNMEYENHDLVGMETEDGLTTAIQRNSAGYPTRMDASGTNIDPGQQPGYDLSYASGDLLQLVDSSTQQGLKTEVASHDVDGQPLEVRRYYTDTEYLTSTNVYDGAGRLLGTTDHRGTLTCYYYDDGNNLTDLVQGLTGASCPLLDDAPDAGNTIRRTHYEYDAEGRTIRVVAGYDSAIAFETRYEYSPSAGLLARTCSGPPEDDRCTEYHYTLDGTIDYVTRPDTRKDKFYELEGGRLKITRENFAGTGLDRIVRYGYDGNGKLLTESSCVAMQNSYDNTSDCEVDSDTVRKRILRDSLGRPTQVQLYTDTDDEENGKRVTNYTYDDTALTTKIHVIGSNKDTIYTRNAAGQLIRVEETDGTDSFIANYEYDGDGRLIKITDPQGQETTFTYDGFGRRLSKTDLSGTTTWAYNDTAGTVRTSRNDGSYVDASNDRLGQISTMTTSDGTVFSYSYDALGRLDVESWSGTGGSGSRDYDYTEFNNVEKITGPFDTVVSYAWDEVNRMTGMSFDSYSTTYEYDMLDRLDVMQSPVGQFSFRFDNYTGALLKTVYPSGPMETEYSRNDLGELIGLATRKGSAALTEYQLTLDSLGRRETIVSEQPVAPSFMNETLALVTQSSGLNPGLLAMVNGSPVSYDGRGNLTSIPEPYPASLSYDVLNRLTAVGTTSHKYDAGRNRLETVRDGKTTRYLLDMSSGLPDLLATMDDQNQIETVYIHGPGGLLAEMQQDGSVRYVVQDFNQNVVGLTDVDGNLNSAYAYTPFGQDASFKGDPSFPFRFAGGVGAMTDPEDIIYMRARYYHPGLQQFTTADLVDGVLGRPQSLNRYAYVEGMGMSGVDPSGLFLKESMSFGNLFAAAVDIASYKNNLTQMLRDGDISYSQFKGLANMNVAKKLKKWEASKHLNNFFRSALESIIVDNVMNYFDKAVYGKVADGNLLDEIFPGLSAVHPILSRLFDYHLTASDKDMEVAMDSAKMELKSAGFTTKTIESLDADTLLYFSDLYGLSYEYAKCNQMTQAQAFGTIVGFHNQARDLQKRGIGKGRIEIGNFRRIHKLSRCSN